MSRHKENKRGFVVKKLKARGPRDLKSITEKKPLTEKKKTKKKTEG